MNPKVLVDKYGIDPIVKKTIEYLTGEILESFNTKEDTARFIGMKNDEVRKYLLEIDDLSRKRIVMKLLLSEQIYSLIEMVECINGCLIKGANLLMRNIYECIVHIETFMNYNPSDDIFRKWVRGEKDERWWHSKELEYLERVRKDEEYTEIAKETYAVLSSYAHPSIYSNVKVLSKDRESGVYRIDKNWFYQSILMVIDGCKYVYKNRNDILTKLREFSTKIGYLMRENYLRRNKRKLR